MLAHPPTAKEQRVSNNLCHEAEKKVIDDSPILHIQCLLPMHRVLWNHGIPLPNVLLSKLLTSIGETCGTTPQA
jgi:hypothetical protein